MWILIYPKYFESHLECASTSLIHRIQHNVIIRLRIANLMANLYFYKDIDKEVEATKKFISPLNIRTNIIFWIFYTFLHIILILWIFASLSSSQIHRHSQTTRYYIYCGLYKIYSGHIKYSRQDIKYSVQKPIKSI